MSVEGEGKMKKKTQAKRPKRITGKWDGLFGIQNHVGGIWTPRTFLTADAAKDFLDGAQLSWPEGDLRRHKVVPVRVTVTAI
jgi:hypothetical protein